jgi:hypothetical protein
VTATKQAAGPPQAEDPAATTELVASARQDEAHPIVTPEMPGPDPETGAGAEVEQQIARRLAAAMRLPPMSCGCRDPESPAHEAGLCRYRRRVA